MSQQWPGGLIRKTPPTPTGPYQDGTAPGVWTLDQMNYWLKQGLWPIAGNSQRGLFGGGNFVGGNTIQYITISSTGNATDFGDLLWQVADLGACSSSTRALFLGRDKQIDYVTISTTGNSVYFGDGYALASLNYRGIAGCSNATRGLWSGNMNYGGSASNNTVSYSTIATTGNGTYFGDLTQARMQVASCASPTRGVTAGGYSTALASAVNVIDYATIATLGNYTYFGDLTITMRNFAGCSSATRGLFGGGGALSNVINYITIASAGYAIDFGDLTTTNTEGIAACSSSTRGVFGGSYSPNSNVMSYVTIATTGNATYFGDLLEAGGYRAGCSNVHGGL